MPDRTIPLLDLKRQYLQIKDEVEESVSRLFLSQSFILGKEVEDLESEIASYCQTRFAVGVSSGTDALLSSMMAIDISEGDEVITTPYSFFATAGSILRLGAKPVFVDIEKASFNIDASLVETAITSRTKAILPVHLFGQTAEMTAIMEIADRHNLPVIEDACQAIGADDNGAKAGSLGVAGCFSFFPSKNLGGAGDGGIVTTNDAVLAEKLRALRNHGQEERYKHKYLGGNFRLDALQAAVLRVKLRHLDKWNDNRRKNAAIYTELLTKVELPISLPGALPRRKHVYNQFVIRAERRDDLLLFLRKRGIGCEIYYPIAIHQQECLAHLQCDITRSDITGGDTTTNRYLESELAANETLALPIYPELEEEEIRHIVAAITAFYS